MKALEILKHKWIAGNVIYDEDTDRHTRYLKYDDRLIEEAIQELEELNSRSCESYKYYKKTIHQDYKTCFLIKNNWYQQEGGYDFEADCGMQFTIFGGMPSENNMNFCTKCGKKLIEHKHDDY